VTNLRGANSEVLNRTFESTGEAKIVIKTGCCSGIQYYDLIAQSGYDTIVLGASELTAFSKYAFREVKKKTGDGPLETIGLNMFCEPGLKLTGPSFDLKQISEYTGILLDRAAEINIRYIGIGAPKSRNLQPGDSPEIALAQFRSALSKICALARPYGIDILLESVCSIECNFITTTSEALEEIRRAGLDNLHLVYDMYHEYMENQGPDIIKEAGNEIKAIHLAQNKNKRRYYLDEKTAGDYGTYFTVLKQSGYQGEICVEAFEGDPETEIPLSASILRKIIDMEFNSN
jgi:sugar phosphate isomerase/epimerase